jgi:hypothetical protein
MIASCDRCDARKPVPAAGLHPIDVAQRLVDFAMEHSKNHCASAVTSQCTCGASYCLVAAEPPEVAMRKFYAWLIQHREHEGD